MPWNYRIMRHVENVAANQETFYAMHEVYYEDDGAIKSWTQEPCASPFGETLDEMVNDLAWIATGLTKPVLDFENGEELEPAAMLADDLMALFKDGTISTAKAPAVTDSRS